MKTFLLDVNLNIYNYDLLRHNNEDIDNRGFVFLGRDEKKKNPKCELRKEGKVYIHSVFEFSI